MELVNNNEELKTLLVRGTINDFKNIVIVGLPASGKTQFSEYLFPASIKAGHPTLKSFGRALIHTDDYMHHGYEESLYKMMSDLATLYKNMPVMIEGVQAYRLLRKGIVNNDFFADLVITCDCAPEILEQRRHDRDPKKDYTAMDKNLHTVYMGYLNLLENFPGDPKPKFLTYDTGI